jgi:glycosyltransferase involved in cell wall biosynthesis
MVSDGETGLLVEPGSERGLREALGRLQDRPDLVEEMGRKARQRVEREFNSETHYRRIMEIYKPLVGRRGSGRKAG